MDAELPCSYIAPDILAVVDRFEPFGTGNEPIVFASNRLKITALTLMGKNDPKHLKMTVDTGKHQWPAVFWNATDNSKTEIRTGDTVDMAYSFDRDCYRKVERPQILVRDIRKSGV